MSIFFASFHVLFPFSSFQCLRRGVDGSAKRLSGSFARFLWWWLCFVAEDIPNAEGWVVSGDADLLLRYGVQEFYMPCMQTDAAVGIGARCTVFEVSAYG